MNTIKIGVVPGTITEVVIEGAKTVAEIAELAGLNVSGYQVRINGEVKDGTTSVSSDATILLAKQIKGNADFTVKIGVVPGTIQEIALAGETTVAEIADMAGLSTIGYQVRVNGEVKSNDTVVTSNATVLLAKQIKGNADFSVKVGVVPGTITEVALSGATPVAEVLALANLSADGYQIRINGEVSSVDAVVESTATILLARQIKGNRKEI